MCTVSDAYSYCFNLVYTLFVHDLIPLYSLLFQFLGDMVLLPLSGMEVFSSNGLYTTHFVVWRARLRRLVSSFVIMYHRPCAGAMIKRLKADSALLSGARPCS